MKKNKKQKFIDIARSLEASERITNLIDSGNFKSVLFSRGKKATKFFTEDSKLYITPKEQEQLRKGIKLDRKVKKWDSLSSRVKNEFVRYQPSASSILLKLLEERLEIVNESVNQASEKFAGQFSLVRLWNLSIVGSILFGMVTMTFIYRYLGQGAAADQSNINPVARQEIQIPNTETKVLSNDELQSFSEQVMQIEQASDQDTLEKEIKQMVKGHPIEAMVPYIAKKDRNVAAFLIAIAKKESSWGEHHPVLNGQDCYNYWGYRGKRNLMGSGGHTCFNSPKDAVDTVAKRINTLVNEDGKDTPEKMVLWKCGDACKKDSGAKKWISDVNTVFEKLNKED